MSDVDDIKELVRFLATSLVDEPEEVEVETVDGEDATIVELTVAESDLGKVIGKEGRTARAMRALLAATSARMRKRAVLDILE